MPGPSQSPRVSADWLAWLVKVLAVAVLWTRLMTPTEGAALGETLGCAAASFFVLAVAGLALAAGSLHRPVVHPVDFLVAALCGLPVISAAVHFGSGDDRALVTLAWEWGGLAATWITWRLISSQPGALDGIWRAVIAAVVGLSLLGVWQHHWGLGEARSQYLQLREEWQQLQSRLEDSNAAARDPSAARRLRQLEREMADLGIPTDEQGLKLWEARLLSSSEPVGRFALANTLGGLLLVGLCGWSLVLTNESRQPGRGIGIAVLLAVGYCLLLTKSRTAWGGTLVAAGLMLVEKLRPNQQVSRTRWITHGALGLCLVVILVGIAARLGGLDRFVVLESFKSLRYRFEYWQGTWNMLMSGDAPGRWLTGVGPGNFRQSYLPFKLPESSEEIADPHNFLFDLWAIAGVPGLLAAVALGVTPFVVTGNWLKTRSTDSDNAGAAIRDRAELWGALGAFAILFGLGADGGDPVRLLVWLALPASFALWGLNRVAISIPGPALRAAILLGLLVHLLAAGGIAMPAITQLILLLLIPMAAGNCDGATPSVARWPGFVLALVAAGLLVAAVWLGLSPVLQRNLEMVRGDSDWERGRELEGVARHYRLAAGFDALSPDPLDRLSLVAQSRWQRSGAESDFDDCLTWRRKSIERNPGRVSGWLGLGETWWQKYETTRDPSDAAQAAAALAEAVARHPTQAALLTRLAQAWEAAGDASRGSEVARRAMIQNQINTRLGHLDKILSPEQVAILGRIAAGDPGL